MKHTFDRKPAGRRYHIRITDTFEIHLLARSKDQARLLAASMLNSTYWPVLARATVIEAPTPPEAA